MAELPSTPEVMVEAIERIGRLPAVPTHDWCDQAAAATGDAILPSGVRGVIAVGVGVLRGSNIDQIDAVGVSAGSADAGVADEARRTLRGVGTLPAAVSMGRAESGLTLVPQSELCGSAAWSASPVGRFFGTRGMTAVLIGAGLISDADPTRVLWVLGAVEGNVPIVGDMVFVTVILLALLRRARMALSSGGRDGIDWISPREQEILGHLMLGKSVRQIAEETGRSAHTIHDHVKSLHRKLNATSRGELIARTLGHVAQGTRIRESSRKLKKA